MNDEADLHAWESERHRSFVIGDRWFLVAAPDGRILDLAAAAYREALTSGPFFAAVSWLATVAVCCTFTGAMRQQAFTNENEFFSSPACWDVLTNLTGLLWDAGIRPPTS